MLTYILVGSLLYVLLLMNLPLLPNRSNGITYLKAMRGLVLIPIIGCLLYLAVFRSLNVGTDYSMYYKFFLQGNYTGQFDYFITLIYDLAQQQGNFLFFTFIITSLFIVFNLMAIKKITYNFFVSFTFFVLSFYFFFVFNGMRQAVAISLIFIAIYYIQKQKLKTKDFLVYLLLIALAAEFHISAWFMLPLVFLRFFKVNKPFLLIAFSFTVFGYFTPFIKNFIDEFLLLFDFYAQKYEDNPEFFFSVNKEKSLVQFMPVVIQYFFLYYALTLKRAESLKEKFLINYYLVFLLLYAASGVEAIDRLQYYFYPSIILFYDYLIHIIYANNEIKKRSQLVFANKIIALASVSFWFLYFVVRIIQGTGGITPYEFLV